MHFHQWLSLIATCQISTSRIFNQSRLKISYGIILVTGLTLEFTKTINKDRTQAIFPSSYSPHLLKSSLPFKIRQNIFLLPIHTLCLRGSPTLDILEFSSSDVAGKTLTTPQGLRGGGQVFVFSRIKDSWSFPPACVAKRALSRKPGDNAASDL